MQQIERVRGVINEVDSALQGPQSEECARPWRWSSRSVHQIYVSLPSVLDVYLNNVSVIPICDKKVVAY